MDQKTLIAVVAVIVAVIAVIAAAYAFMSNGSNDKGDNDKTVAVSGIYLNKAELSLDIGESATISCTVSPAGASDKNVKWASSDVSVATVTNGVVKAVAAGSAVITATTNDGGYAASCKVAVAEEKPIAHDMTVYDVNSNRLVVYGNANNDDTIDERDLAIIQSYADGTSTWSKSLAPFADANADGKIDQSDVNLVKKIVSKETCKVKYLNYKNHPTEVTYPLPTDKIGTTYYQAASMARLLGLWDNVTACGSGSLNNISSPGWESKYSYGVGYNVDPQTVVDSGVHTVICYTQTDTTASQMVELVERTGIDLNVLCINHEHLLKCVCSYGFLFDKTDITDKYLATADECSESLIETMSPVPSSEQPTVACVMLYGTATTEKIRVLGYNYDISKNTHNLSRLIHSVPNVNQVMPDVPSYGTYVSSEWFIEKQPDYIILVGSSMGMGTEKNQAECKQIYYDKCKEVFGETNAFKNGNIICCSNGMLNGYSNPLVSLKVLSEIYPQIDDELAQKAFDQWYSYTSYDFGDIASERIYRIGKTA